MSEETPQSKLSQSLQERERLFLSTNEQIAKGMRSYNAVTSLINKWAPVVDERGNITGPPAGDMDNPDELMCDILAMSSLNADLGKYAATASAAAEAAKLNVEAIRATMRIRARTKTSETKLTDKAADEIARNSTESDVACDQLLFFDELARILNSTYFCVRDMAEKLESRRRNLLYRAKTGDES